MKVRLLIGILLVLVLSVSQVSGQCSDSATASGQKTGAACSGTSAQLASTDGASTACCASKTQTAAQLASLTDKPSACCASKAQATATTCSSTASAKLAGLTAQPSACCASKAQATACSSTATASLANSTAKPASACASTTQASTCSSTTAAKLASATPGCPMQAAGIELCAQQQAKIHAILAQARKDLLAVLNKEQQAKFAKFTQGAQLSLMPVVLGRQVSLTTTAATSTQACCASKTAAQTVARTTACSGDCQKACCTGKAVTVAEQKTCPIMKSSPIKKSVFTVYQGKKVYFCCKGCDKEFNKNPEKYTKNLPQFGR